MNNVVGSIFNESFVEKRGLWVPSIVHGSTSYSETRFCQKKKKKQKQKQNANVGTWTQSKHILSQDCQMRACDLWTFLIFTWKCHEFYIPM